MTDGANPVCMSLPTKMLSYFGLASFYIGHLLGHSVNLATAAIRRQIEADQGVVSSNLEGILCKVGGGPPLALARRDGT